MVHITVVLSTPYLPNVIRTRLVSIYYKHFRPTGKALLTMVLPDYTSDVLRGISEISIPGCSLSAESVEKPEEVLGKDAVGSRHNLPTLSIYGNGPFASLPARRSVTLSGVPGKTGIHNLEPLLAGFAVAKDFRNPVQSVPL